MDSDFSSINVGGRLFMFDSPKVMGIINVTPDSFFSSSRVELKRVATVARDMVANGADMIDLGGYSSRPGAEEVSADEELHRLLPAIEEIKNALPDIPLSVDTFRAEVAAQCVHAGADIINDIGGGDLDQRMFETIADLKVPYVLMHMRGMPQNMQQLTDYDNVVADVLKDLAFKCDRLHQLGVNDVIIDPGFGFAKTVDQNYQLLSQLNLFKSLNAPILAGVSRKSMIWKELNMTPQESLNGTTVVNSIALMNGADILRVHDVKPAKETVALYEAYRRNIIPQNLIQTIDRK